MKILAIETSCDETALSIVECSGGAKAPRFKVLKNLINSQIPIHRPFGGVVPNLAKREHIANLPKLLKQLGVRKVKGYKVIKSKVGNINAIAVTVGPGLEPALWTGIEFAKQLAKDLKKPLLGANHMEGHMYSTLLNLTKSDFIRFPAIGLVVSGGHTILVKMDSYIKWTKLGETRDDAAGEAFDKVARLLDLPYPGGPEISKLALKGNPKAINFPRPMLNIKSPSTGSESSNYDFSFSGLKTAVLYHLRDQKNLNSSGRTKQDKANVAASFQQAVLDVLVKKTMRAAREYSAQTVFVCGGVAANQQLRHQLSAASKKEGITFLSPAHEYNTDNAAMIAAAAYLAKLRKKTYKFVADSNLTL